MKEEALIIPIVQIGIASFAIGLTAVGAMVGARRQWQLRFSIHAGTWRKLSIIAGKGFGEAE